MLGHLLQRLLHRGVAPRTFPTSSLGRPTDWNRVEVALRPRKLDDLWEPLEEEDLSPDVTCSICLETLGWSAEPDLTPCRPITCVDHYFHTACLSRWLVENPVCPLCRQPLRVTTGYQPQPEGCNWQQEAVPVALAGHEDCQALRITLVFPAGVQEEDQPLPGTPFAAAAFITWLPSHSEGQRVAELLRTAWDRRLLVRIGVNPETHHMDRLIWNGWEVKTHPDQFPDPSYLSRIKADLAEVGVI